MLWVRPEGSDEASAQAHEPGALASEGGTLSVTARTLVATTREGPYRPLADAVLHDGALRDLLARGISSPSLTDRARMRWVVLAAAAIPTLLLLELDRELYAARVGSLGMLLCDVLVIAYVTFELTRRTPRFPSVVSAVLASVTMRWALVVTRLCARNVHVSVWLALAIAAAGTALALARMPSRERVGWELLAKVGIARADVAVTPPAAPPVPAAVGAALALPLLLFGLRRAGTDVWTQAIAFVVYAAVVPEVLARLTKASGARVPSVASTLLGVFAGLALTAALLHGTHWFFDAGHELARCTGKLDEETKRLLVKEAAETSTGIARVRASTALVLMTAVVVPLAEERIYRGLLMRALVAKYGSAYGLFASAVLFGFAHVGAYEVALYQTVLLGLAFGVAYAEGGLVAAFVVHAAWNLLLIA